MNVTDNHYAHATPRQVEYLDAVTANKGNVAAAARSLGLAKQTLHNSLKNLEKRLVTLGESREYELYRPGGPGMFLSGFSDMRTNAEGKPIWYKFQADKQAMAQAIQEFVETAAADLPRIDRIECQTKRHLKDKITVLPIGDPHIGLLCWSKEVGVDWDLAIAQRVFRNVFTRLLSRLPNTQECILVNTGDFFHADNINSQTSRSGHVVDTDGRYGKWLDTGVIVVRMLIEACLRKYKKVTFVNVKGNHDDILGAALGTFTDHMYEKQTRLTVMRGESSFQYVRRGKVLLGFAHGHTCKLSSLPGKMADDAAELWGQTTYRHWITGHVHHNSWTQFKEHPGCTVETVGIIPPKDAYAYGGAYGANRTTQGLIFDIAAGSLVERHIEHVTGAD